MGYVRKSLEVKMINKEELINEYSQMAYKGEAALFVGAGISIPYGLPDFQGLIKELARGTIDLEILSLIHI